MSDQDKLVNYSGIVYNLACKEDRHKIKEFRFVQIDFMLNLIQLFYKHVLLPIKGSRARFNLASRKLSLFNAHLAHQESLPAVQGQTLDAEIGSSHSIGSALQDTLQMYQWRLQIFHQLHQEILRANSAHSIAESALCQLRKLIPCERASVAVFNFEREEAELLAVNSAAIHSNLRPGTFVPFSSFPLIVEYRALSDPSKLKVIIRRVEPDNTNLRVEGITSHVQIPMLANTDLVGSLNVGLSHNQTLTEEHIEIAREVANSVAIAIQQARLKEALRINADQLRHQVIALRQAESALEKERNSLAQRVEQRTMELLQTNQKLAKALQMKDEFLATMSHELRTPLSSIMVYSELMESGIHGPLSAKQADSVQNIQEASQHLLSLINDVLDVAKIEGQAIQLEEHLIDIHELCEGCIHLIQLKAENKGLSVEFVCKQGFAPLVGDGRRIKQIITNLLNNAVKFTPEGGKIGLNVYGEVASGRICFTVWDTGIGVAHEDFERIFQPFIQVDARLSRNYQGAGLGLALARCLARLHKGDISIESALGQGSRFTFWMPLEAMVTVPHDKDMPEACNNTKDRDAPLHHLESRHVEGRIAVSPSSCSTSISHMPTVLIAEVNEQT